MFIDKKSRVWDLSFTCAELFAVQEAEGIDLSDIEAVIELLSSPRAFLGVCWVLAKAEARDIDFITFCAGFDGDTMEAAQAELWRAIEVFSPSGRKELIANLAAKIADHTKAQIEAAGARLKQSGSLPEGSESTPSPSPTDSLT
jgi:hypothetical protein